RGTGRDRVAAGRHAGWTDSGGCRVAVLRLGQLRLQRRVQFRPVGIDPDFSSSRPAGSPTRGEGISMSASVAGPVTKPVEIKKSLIDAVIAGLLALIVFGPIVGIVLDGYSFNLQPTRVAWLVAVVMVGRFLISLFLQTPKGIRLSQSFESSDSGVHVLKPDHKSSLYWIIPLLIVIAIVFPIFANKYILTVVILGLIYVLLGLGLNIVVGLAGLLDLGYVAFYAIGAYGLALGYQYLGLGFWSALPLAAIAAALAGCILGFPVLRMHGDYLAIV
ncbi:High-affinity branched-chain amino acid ABC transporter permease BraE, partial [Pseudomonas coronafaciens pv. garcae]